MNKKLVMLVSAGVLFGGVFADDEEPVAPTISSASVALDASRTTSTRSATVAVGDLGGAESVPITVTATPQINKVESGEFFDLPILTGSTTISTTGSCTIPLAGLIPGRTYDLQVVATGVDGVAATNVKQSAVTVPNGFGEMCYKPNAGLSAYPWTAKKWYSDHNNQTALAYPPSLGDDVLLYSSKNVSVPLSVGAGVHAETKGMAFSTGENWGNANRQRFLVAACGADASRSPRAAAATIRCGRVRRTRSTRASCAAGARSSARAADTSAWRSSAASSPMARARSAISTWDSSARSARATAGGRRRTSGIRRARRDGTW